MFSIGQLAKKAKVSNRTIRYYEELGLLVPKFRGSNRYRYYDESHVERLGLVKMLQESGFALKEIVAALKVRGLGILITDHNVRETLSITDRAYIMCDGVILKEGTSEFLANDPEARRIYLGEKFRLN